MTTKTLSEGIYIQIYRDVIPGRTQNEKMRNLANKLDLFKSLGVVGILMHGFTTEMDVDKFKELAKLCLDRGLLCLAAYGLNSSDPLGKAQRMAEVANLPECAALVLDMEGSWEDEQSDKQTAITLGVELKKLAPNVLIVDQPWPVPTVHWSLFPWEETAAYVDIRAAQWYCNDWKSQYGKERYNKCFTWFTNSWKQLDERLAKKNLVKPEIKTLQGYAWDDIFSDLVNCLTSNSTLFVWCEPWPSDGFIKGIKIKNELAKRGFIGPEAVKNYQLSTNGKLTADNVCGPKTLKELGF